MATSKKKSATKSKAKSASAGRRKRSAKPAAAKNVSQDTAAEAAAGEGELEFGDSLTITDVAEWRQRLTDALKGSSTIKLDAGGIEQVDGAGMQLLAAFVKEAVTLHVAFEWSGASQALCEAADQSGLADLLRLGEVSKAA